MGFEGRELMAFDGVSCLLFWSRIKRGQLDSRELRGKLGRHALVCHCDCPVCIDLRESHQLTLKAERG